MIEQKTEGLRQALEPLYYRLFLIPPVLRQQKKRIKQIQDKKGARIAFVMSSLPMWRAQGLYDFLRQDSHFQLIQALSPFSSFTDDQKESVSKQMQDYCKSKEMPFINLTGKTNPGETLKKAFDPDIVFYPQPYNHLFYNDLDSPFFQDRLICYIPYAMLTAKEEWAYRNHLNNIAWRIYYHSEERKQDARKVLYNNGKNIRVVGELTTDLFSSPVIHNPWKPQGNLKKKVIWAPHFSLIDEGYLHRDSFIRLCETMWDIAQQFQDRLQFAFKPHPKLKSVLYERPDWGKEKTDAYYRKWANGNNTQLETGQYIDLFKTSDAMIHDCSSFTVEYHFTEKPVLFITDDPTSQINSLNDFGRDAILAHYQGNTETDIIRFLNDVVLNEQDPMLETRILFHDKYLKIPYGNTVAENIYHDLLISLGFKQ